MKNQEIMENFKKKYKEVLRKATKIHRDDDEKIKHYMEVLFPELAESEDDRIRKELISFLQLPHPQFVGESEQEKWIAWLEKQESIDENEVAKCVLNEVANSIMCWLDSNCAEGNMCLSSMECEDIENAVRNANWQKIYGYMKKKLEKQGGQKPQGKSALEAIKEEKVDNANKIEPKFKVGDWCIDNEDGTIFQIVKVLDNTYIYKTNVGKEYSCTHYSLENDAKLWTIQDAKDGDVLVDKYNNIGIFQECKGICWHSYIYLGCDGELRGFNIGGSHEQTGTHPATKEQREQLEKAMADAGYEWDAEKKKCKIFRF